jgi:hypothetical protein
MFRHIVGGLLLLLLTASAVSADPAASNKPPGRTTPLWTFVGAGAGFGLGVWAGLSAFDDAIDSDRKVWTTAVLAATAGGLAGFFVDRHRARSARRAPAPSLTLSARQQSEIVAAASKLGSGQLKQRLDAALAK